MFVQPVSPLAIFSAPRVFILWGWSFPPALMARSTPSCSVHRDLSRPARARTYPDTKFFECRSAAQSRSILPHLPACLPPSLAPQTPAVYPFNSTRMGDLVSTSNTAKMESMRNTKQSAIQSTIERNPSAFVSKFERRVGGKRAHNAGCNCKKSACLKKYCECFQAGVACGSNCKCSNCKNFEGAGGGRKRRAPDPSAASVLVQAPRTQLVQAPRTPPRSVSRGRRPGAVVATGPSHDEVGILRESWLFVADWCLFPLVFYFPLLERTYLCHKLRGRAECRLLRNDTSVLAFEFCSLYHPPVECLVHDLWYQSLNMAGVCHVFHSFEHISKSGAILKCFPPLPSPPQPFVQRAMGVKFAYRSPSAVT